MEFEMKIMSIFRYGMECISPRLTMSSMLNLDRCKTLYLKAVLRLSNHTSNTFVLELTNQKSLC